MKRVCDRDYVAEDRAEKLVTLDTAIADWTATVARCARDAQRYIAEIANTEVGETWDNEGGTNKHAKKWRRACAAGELAGQVLAELQMRRLRLLAASIGDAL